MGHNVLHLFTPVSCKYKERNKFRVIEEFSIIREYCQSKCFNLSLVFCISKCHHTCPSLCKCLQFSGKKIIKIVISCIGTSDYITNFALILVFSYVFLFFFFRGQVFFKKHNGQPSNLGNVQQEKLQLLTTGASCLSPVCIGSLSDRS